MDWHKHYTYTNGVLYYKERKGNGRYDKRHNTLFAGTVAGGGCVGRYAHVKLNGKTHKVHRVVWEMHHGAIPKGLVIHHINSNKKDNRLENLALVTPKQNMHKMVDLFKGYKVTMWGRYRATRIFNFIKVLDKTFGTPCGAYMAYKTALL